MEIMWIMLIFNLVIFLFGQIGLSTTVTGTNPSSVDGLYTGGFLVFAGVMAGASILNYIRNNDKSMHAILYGTFAISFWGVWTLTMNTFNSLIEEFQIKFSIMSVFTVIAVAVFIIGFAQMATGGWKYYD